MGTFFLTSFFLDTYSRPATEIASGIALDALSIL